MIFKSIVLNIRTFRAFYLGNIISFTGENCLTHLDKNIASGALFIDFTLLVCI